MSVKFTRRGTFAATLTAVLAMSAGTMASAADMKVGANVGNVPWEFQNEKGEIRRLRDRPRARRSASASNMNVVDREHPVQRPVRGGSVGSGRCGRILDHHHQEASRVGILRPALLRQRPIAGRAAELAASRTWTDERQGRRRRYGLDRRHVGDAEPGRSTSSPTSVATRACPRPCSTSLPVASTAISATSRRSSTTSRTSRSTRWSSASRPASNTR